VRLVRLRRLRARAIPLRAAATARRVSRDPAPAGVMPSTPFPNASHVRHRTRRKSILRHFRSARRDCRCNCGVGLRSFGRGFSRGPQVLLFRVARLIAVACVADVRSRVGRSIPRTYAFRDLALVFVCDHRWRSRRLRPGTKRRGRSRRCADQPAGSILGPDHRHGKIRESRTRQDRDVVLARHPAWRHPRLGRKADLGIDGRKIRHGRFRTRPDRHMACHYPGSLGKLELGDESKSNWTRPTVGAAIEIREAMQCRHERLAFYRVSIPQAAWAAPNSLRPRGSMLLPPRRTLWVRAASRIGSPLSLGPSDCSRGAEIPAVRSDHALVVVHVFGDPCLIPERLHRRRPGQAPLPESTIDGAGSVTDGGSAGPQPRYGRSVTYSRDILSGILLRFPAGKSGGGPIAPALGGEAL